MEFPHHSRAGRRIVDGDNLIWLTGEIDRLNQNLDGLRAEVAALITAPAMDAALFRRLALRIEDAMARLQGLNGDLAVWRATLPEPSDKSPQRPPDRRHSRPADSPQMPSHYPTGAHPHPDTPAHP